MRVKSKAGLAACVVAFLSTALVLLSALSGYVSLFPLALIPLASGIGILRGRVWSAYGYALFQAGQVLLIPLILTRSHGETKATPLLTGAIIGLGIIALFATAGWSLSKAGASRGRSWAWIAITVFSTIPLLFIEPFVNPSGSMENTLLIGDRFFVQRFPRRTPERGSVITFVYPVDRQQVSMKRVIGLPGDRIKMIRRAVYRDGSQLDEPYVVHKFPYDPSRDEFPTDPNSNFSFLPSGIKMLQQNVFNGEVVVPAGKYFVLGDNRDNSLDSRYWGFVDAKDVIGRPFLIYGSEAPVDGPRTLTLSRVRWSRLFKLL